MFRLLLSTLICTILTACAPSETQQALSSTIEKEKTKIDTTEVFTSPPAKREKDPIEARRQQLNPNVKLTPEQLLLKTLKLMHETKSVDELTPDRLEEIYGVSVKKLSETRLYGLLEDISDSWWQEFSIVKSLSSKYFSIEFNHDPNISVNTFPECNITFEDFLSRAEKLGFTVQHQLRYGAVYEFTRLNNGYLHVQVVPLRREVGDEPQEGELNCIGMINLY